MGEGEVRGCWGWEHFLCSVWVGCRFSVVSFGGVGGWELEWGRVSFICSSVVTREGGSFRCLKVRFRFSGGYAKPLRD